MPGAKSQKRQRTPHERQSQLARTRNNKQHQLTRRLQKARFYHREKEVAHITEALQNL